MDMKVAVKKDESDEAESDASSDASDSDDESSSSSEADGSSSSSSEEESDVEEKENVPSKKRKADEDMNAETENRKKQNVEVGDDEPTGVRFSNLAWSVTKDSLEAYILEVGVTPSNVRLIMDRESGRSKGFGFADFASKAEANKAIEAFNEQDLEGRPCRAEISSGQSFTKPAGFGNTQNKFAAKPKSEPTSTLFVGNMSFSSTEDSLYSAFSEQGKVIGVRIPTDKETGRLKGFAYVEFSSVDDAKAALESLDGAPVDGRAIRLDFASVRPANGGSGDRDGARRGGRGGSRGGRGGPRGGGRGGRGGASRTGASAKGAIQQFSGNKMTFDD